MIEKHNAAQKGFAPIFADRTLKVLLTGLYLAAGSSAQADCGALQPLAVMHDAYRALVSENTPHSKSIAANQLLKFVPIYSAESFDQSLTELELDIEIARLEKVLVDAFFLSRDALAGGLIQGNISNYHQRNADWLTETVARTGCFRQTGSAPPAQSVAQSAFETNRPLPDATAKQSTQSKTPVEAFAGILLAIIAMVAGYMIYQSRPLRIKRVARLPRHSVAFKASAEFEQKNSPIIVLDVSIGGAKIECDRPPVAKEKITLNLPCGSVPATIVWATAFYAGVMFEKPLNENDLQDILNDDGVTTRSRLSNVF